MPKKMNAYEAPAKKRITRRTIDLAINKRVNDDAFSIELEGDKTVDFKKFINPVTLQIFIDKSMSLTIKSDSESGMFYIDQLGIALLTHMFLIETQSSMELPQAKTEGNDGGEEDETLDANTLAVIGEYFITVSEEYKELYDDVEWTIEQRAMTIAELRNSVLREMTKGFDINEFLQSSAVQAAFKAELDKIDQKPIEPDEVETEISDG